MCAVLIILIYCNLFLTSGKFFPARITGIKEWHTVLREVIIMDNRNFNNPENKNQQNGQNKNQQNSQNKNQQNSQNSQNKKDSNPENRNNNRGY